MQLLAAAQANHGPSYEASFSDVPRAPQRDEVDGEEPEGPRGLALAVVCASVNVSRGAVFLVERAGKLLASSEDGAKLLSTCHGFSQRGERLVPTDPRSLRRFESWLHTAGRSTPRGQPGPGQYLAVRTTDPLSPLYLEVRPWSSRIHDDTGGALELFTVDVLGLDMPAAQRLEQLSQMFDLTPREGKVALHWVVGISDQEIAACLGLGDGAVRSLIRHVFMKTGVRRRSELVRMFVMNVR